MICLFSVTGCALQGGATNDKHGILPFFSNTPLEVSLINARIDGQTEQMTAMAEELATLSDMVAKLTLKEPAQTAAAPSLSLAPVVLSSASEASVSEEPAVKAEVDDGVIPQTKTLIGQVEWVWTDSLNTHMKARIDTGAALSSLNAVDVKIYEKDGKRWTRFTVLAENEDARALLTQKKSNSKRTLDATKESRAKSQRTDEDEALLWVIDTPVERFVRIRQAASNTVERRPVVKLPIRLGPIQEMTEFTLSNRQKMEFPMLLGRSFLKDLAVVDVSERYLVKKQWVSKQVSINTP